MFFTSGNIYMELQAGPLVSCLGDISSLQPYRLWDFYNWTENFEPCDWSHGTLRLSWAPRRRYHGNTYSTISGPCMAPGLTVQVYILQRLD